MMLRLLATAFVSQKLNLFIFTHAPRQKEIITPRQKEITHSSQTLFSSAERGEDYGFEKITKIKPIMVLVTSFDKFYHLWNLYISGFCFVVP